MSGQVTDVDDPLWERATCSFSSKVESLFLLGSLDSSILMELKTTRIAVCGESICTVRRQASRMLCLPYPGVGRGAPACFRKEVISSFFAAASLGRTDPGERTKANLRLCFLHLEDLGTKQGCPRSRRESFRIQRGSARMRRDRALGTTKSRRDSRENTCSR